MNHLLDELLKLFQKLILTHQVLLELVIQEKKALVEVDLSSIQKYTLKKQTLVQEIHTLEVSRKKLIAELSIFLKIPFNQLNFFKILEEVKKSHPEALEELKNKYEMITKLIQFITDQNYQNQIVTENFLNHINQMKKNLIQDSLSYSSTYTRWGEKTSLVLSSKLILKEI